MIGKFQITIFNKYKETGNASLLVFFQEFFALRLVMNRFVPLVENRCNENAIACR